MDLFCRREDTELLFRTKKVDVYSCHVSHLGCSMMSYHFNYAHLLPPRIFALIVSAAPHYDVTEVLQSSLPLANLRTHALVSLSKSQIK